MEDLPFEDDSFDGAVSQFGFEYGDVVAGAAEMLRVVKKDGVIALMVHRGDGPIHGRDRDRVAAAVAFGCTHNRSREGTTATSALCGWPP